MKTIATHDGSFHTDEIFAVAILKLVFPNAKIIRTRDENKFSKADFRVDVGNKYNSKTGDFDHHQNDFNKKRKNKIPYASAGLVWEEFGKKLVKSKKVCEEIDKKLIQPIDAMDSGLQITLKEIIPNYGIGQVTNSFLPIWEEKSKENYEKGFLGALDFAIELLKREIKIVDATEKGEKIVKEIIAENKNKDYVLIDKNIPFHEYAIEKTNLKFVVHKTSSGAWGVWAVKKSVGSFENRKDLPKKWAGLEGEELVKVTGVKDSIFCHKNLFMALAESKQGAIKLVELALKK